MRKPKRKKRRLYTLQGMSASGYEWAAELGVPLSTFVHNVRSAEKIGATREQAMLAVVQHFGGPSPRYGGMWKKLAPIMAKAKEEESRKEVIKNLTISNREQV